MPRDALTAVRAILDFIYLTQYSTHDEDTLSYMSDALDLSHTKKSSFIDIGVHDDLNIPKFHALQHYVEMIRLFGCTDNYNTEMFERLHIDYAKKGWRASNKREEFPQMTHWLARQENVQTFNKELSWITEQQRLRHLQKNSLSVSAASPGTLLLPKEPTAPSKVISAIELGHRIPTFSLNLKRYLAMLTPGSSRAEVERSLLKQLPFNHLDVYYSFKFSPETLDDEGSLKDVVKATPLKGGRFDTVVVLTGDSAETTSFSGTRIGRVKVIFQLPSQLTLLGTHKTPSPSWWPSSALAYVEWYSPPSQTPLEQKSHNMATVHKLPLIDGNARPAPHLGKAALTVSPLTFNLQQSQASLTYNPSATRLPPELKKPDTRPRRVPDTQGLGYGCGRVPGRVGSRSTRPNPSQTLCCGGLEGGKYSLLSSEYLGRPGGGDTVG
ncbi:hypothetical protein EV360DRAFT_87873 [Lentinula raphanica]|nr:hypothetical protein EV360DRAFT_87873 [Lentinula raphanica]